MNDQANQSAVRCGPRAGWTSAVIAAVLFVLATAPTIASGTKRGPGWGDQWAYHMVVIDRFIAQWPHVNIKDYEAATTPLYHIIVAGFGHYVSSNLMFLQFVGSLFTLGLVMTVARWVGARLGVLTGVLFTLPLIADVFVYCRATHVNPDNAGWWLVAIVMLLALRPRFDTKSYIWIAVSLMFLVLFRQIHVWCAGLVWAAAWLGPADQPLGPGIRGLLTDQVPRMKRTGIALMASAPAILVLVGFVLLWGHLMPPLMQTTKEHPNSAYKMHFVPIIGGNTTVPALILALTGALGPFFLGYHWTAIRRFWGPDHIRAAIPIAIGVLIGLIVGVLPETTPGESISRGGDIWTVAAKFPVFAHRSVMIVGLSMAGGAVLGIIWSSLDRRTRWLFVAAWLGLTVSQMTSFNSWQRYVEPGILLFLSVFTTLALRPVNASPGAPATNCPRCAYDLAGLKSNTCPECGARTDLVVENRPAWFAPAGILVLAILLSVITYLKFTSVRDEPNKPDRQPLMLTPGGNQNPAPKN